MKLRIISVMNLIVVLALVLVFFFPGNMAYGQQPSQEEQDKMMKAWMEYASPGANHKYLEGMAGNWDVAMKMWMYPGAEPAVDKGSADAKMILGGRYLYVYNTGQAMGMPMEGIFITGFDNLSKKFNSLWIDNMGTGFFPSSGTLDETGKIKTETGMWDDYTSGKKVPVKLIHKVIDADKYVFEMYMQDIKGVEFKSMEATYTRKK